MEPFSEQASIALNMYLSRGQMALEKLEDGKFDEAFELLKWRKAAFYGFVFVDKKSSRNGIFLSNDTRLIDIYEKINAIDDQLSKVINDHLEKCRHEIRRVGANRQKIKKFRSGLPTNKGFQTIL